MLSNLTKDYREYYRRRYKSQAGFLLPLALFIVVVASVVALALLKQVVQPTIHSTASGIAAKSAYVAKTGAELAAHQIFFPATSPVFDRQQMDSRCEGLTINPGFAVAGMNQCTLAVTCECRYENNTTCDSGNPNNYNGSLGIENSFYRIQSDAQCGPDLTGNSFAKGFYRFELNKKAP